MGGMDSEMFSQGGTGGGVHMNFDPNEIFQAFMGGGNGGGLGGGIFSSAFNDDVFMNEFMQGAANGQRQGRGMPGGFSMFTSEGGFPNFA